MSKSHITAKRISGNPCSTGDNSPRDCGWEFDPETICEVRPKEVTTIVYEEVGEDA